GGPIIDRLAPHGDAHAVRFQTSQIKHADRRDHKRGDRKQDDHKQDNQKQVRAEEDGPHFDFSYSGIKTAVLRYVETENLKPAIEARRPALTGIDKPDRKSGV